MSERPLTRRGPLAAPNPSTSKSPFPESSHEDRYRRDEPLACAAIPATAGHYGGDGGTNWGAVVGAGILGAATAPAPQPQIIVVVPPPSQPAYAVPEPTYVSPPPSQRHWWCPTSHRWYPDVFACAVPWSR